MSRSRRGLTPTVGVCTDPGWGDGPGVPLVGWTDHMSRKPSHASDDSQTGGGRVERGSVSRPVRKGALGTEIVCHRNLKGTRVEGVHRVGSRWKSWTDVLLLRFQRKSGCKVRLILGNFMRESLTIRTTGTFRNKEGLNWEKVGPFPLPTVRSKDELSVLEFWTSELVRTTECGD